MHLSSFCPKNIGAYPKNSTLAVITNSTLVQYLCKWSRDENLLQIGLIKKFSDYLPTRLRLRTIARQSKAQALLW